METTLILLFCLGALLGALANYFVDGHGWTPRYRSPWRVWPKEFWDRLNATDASNGVSKKRRKNTVESTMPIAKRWFDFLPIFGWFSLSRIGARLEALPESERLPGLESRNFWIRPFFVELLAALGVPMLYLWEVEMQGLLPTGVAAESWNVLACRFAVHVFFFALLLAASLIDIDDMIIPDSLTIPGTVLGLFFAAILPWTLLPATELRIEVIMPPPVAGQNPAAGVNFVHGVAPTVVPLNLCSPNPVKGKGLKLDGNDKRLIWAVTSSLWGFWCFAMLNRIWYGRLPFRKAAAIFCRYLRRSPSTKWYVAVALLGSAGFAGMVCLPRIFAQYYIGLLSALVGMAAGMAMIWSVRLIGRVVLGREAMGFGDVTLMGMIGVFVGWQSCILIFFLAPFAGLILGIANTVSGRGREFPYGPFLCMATAVLVVFWRPIWDFVTPIFELGWIVVAVMLVCLVMLGVLLGLWRWIRARLFSE